jgi:tetratricopeptide (TPR) repeat protein
LLSQPINGLDAVDCYRQAIARTPKDHDEADWIFNLLRDSLFCRGSATDLEEAIECYRTALSLAKYDRERVYLMSLGTALLFKGEKTPQDLDEASDCYRQSLALMKRDASKEYLDVLIWGLQEVSHPSNQCFEFASVSSKYLGDALLFRNAPGDLDSAIKSYQDAVQLLTRMDNISALFAMCNNALGEALRQRNGNGDLDSSIQCFRTAADTSPEVAEFANNLRLALLDQANSHPKKYTGSSSILE